MNIGCCPRICTSTLNAYTIDKYKIGNTLGEKLRYYRLNANLTQEELASIVGYSSGVCIKDIEANRKLPGREISKKLATYFKLNTIYFFDEYLENTHDISNILKKYSKDKNVKNICDDLGIRTNTWYKWISSNKISREYYLKLKEYGIFKK